MTFTIKYIGEKIPNNLYLLTKKLIGYSSLDHLPMYKMKFDVNPELKELIKPINDTNIQNYKDKILLFLREQKTNRLLHNIIDNELSRFTEFLQIYYDNINTIIIY